MAWFKVDDGFLTSSKVISIPRSIRPTALGVWLAAGVWSAHEMKDGLVPAHVLEELGCTDEIRDALVSAGLWVVAEKGCILIHNWSKYQPTREELEAKREAVSAARAEAGKRSGQARRTNAEQNRTNVNPEPEPEPLTTPNGVVRATRIPDDFVLTDVMHQWATENVPGLDAKLTTAMFVDYWQSASGRTATKKDWVAAWRVWLRKDWVSSRDSQVVQVRDRAVFDDRRERERQRAAELSAESARARADAVDAPDCPHGVALWRCAVCTKELAA